MRTLLRQVEDLFDIAAAGTGSSAAIVLGRDGTFRMLDPSGWSLLALKEEFGASAVFKLERRAGRVRIEACDGNERCLVERSAGVSGNQPKAGMNHRPRKIGSGAPELLTVHAHSSAVQVGAERYAHGAQVQAFQAPRQEEALYL